MKEETMNHDEHAEHHMHEHHKVASTKMAASATLHCLIGCAIGEMIGVTIGTHVGFAPHNTVLLAAVLSFVSGYCFDMATASCKAAVW